MVVDGHDPHDRRRRMQLRGILLRGRDSGHAARSAVCGGYDDPERHLLEGETELCWESVLLLVYSWLCDHCSQCAAAERRLGHPADAALCHLAWVSELRRGGHPRLLVHHILGWTEIWQEDHVGISDSLQYDWRT